jgi:hypothetical protein
MFSRIYVKPAIRADLIIGSYNDESPLLLFFDESYASSTTTMLPIIFLLSVLCAFVGIVGFVGKWRSC